jgi:hypothetical protein
VKDVLPSRFGFQSPTWIEGAPLPDLPIVTDYKPEGNKVGASYDSHRGIGLTSIEVAFQRSGTQLLILGDAGVGKTYATMTLLRTMLEAASTDPLAPVPLYLDLSEWQDAGGRLEDWLMSATEAHYGTPRDVLRFWLGSGGCAVALDGLDEMPAAARNDCIKAIEDFRSRFALIPMVVACRTREYDQCRSKLHLPGRVTISDVGISQLLSILETVDAGHSGLAERVTRDRRLRDLLRRPLFLQLAVIAYRNRSASAIRSKNGRWSEAVIDAYLSRAAVRFPEQQQSEGDVPTWLPPLARHLRNQNSSTFYPDRIALELVDNDTQADVERYAGILCAAVTFAAIALVRVATWFFIPLDGPGVAYLGSGWVLLLVFPWLAWRDARKRVSEAPVGRRSAVKALLPRILPRFALAYVLAGAVAAIINNGTAATLFVLLLIGVGLYPGIALIRSSSQLSESELPHYPGEEIRQLWRACLLSAATVTATLSASLFLILGPMDGAEILPLQSWALLPYFVVPLAVVIGITNGGSDLAVRYVARKVLARRGVTPTSFLAEFDRLRRSSVMIPASGGLSFIHALVRDHVARLRINDVPNPRGPAHLKVARDALN